MTLYRGPAVLPMLLTFKEYLLLLPNATVFPFLNIRKQVKYKMTSIKVPNGVATNGSPAANGASPDGSPAAKGVKVNAEQQLWDSYNHLMMSSDVERLRKVFAREELFRKTIDVPGDIVECGVFKG